MTMASIPLKAPYSRYYRRRIEREDEELTHVGPETPCGEYLRRFWQPICFMYELSELPLRVRIMCEDLVVFRDKSGAVGVLDLHCSHRGASLEFGQICQSGIRCAYHGWLFGVDGKVMETPGEPPESTFKDSLYHGAYPVHVYKGLVFVYMGPPDKKPAFPIYDTSELPGYRQWIGLRHMLPANWLQIKENCMDPAHLYFLHTIAGNPQDLFRSELSITPELDYMHSDIGMIYIDSRRVSDKVWVRIADFICPNIHQFGSSGLNFEQEMVIRPVMTQWSVPIDDTHTMNFRLRHVLESEKTDPPIMAFGQSEDRPYADRQRTPGDYDVQVGQRPIAVHALENLATTDRGVVMLRRLVREGIRATAAGNDPKGIYSKVAPNPIPTYSGMTVVRVPPASDPAEDRRLVRQTGRKTAEERMRGPAPARARTEPVA
jgi:nitrite reductase/ring-hydroxylating ferredoxin subunit